MVNLSIKLNFHKHIASFRNKPNFPILGDDDILDTPRWKKILESISTYKTGDKYSKGLPYKKQMYKYIKILDAYELKLKKLPREILQLKNLKNLRINDNRIKKLPKDIMQLDKLEALCLCNNYLHKLPNSLVQLKNLNELGISNNPKLLELPENFDQLKLTSLSIDGKLLATYIDTILKITTLEELEIYRGKISKNLFRKLTMLPNLKDLTFVSIKNKKIPNNIGVFEKLEFFTISKSKRFKQFDNNITQDIFSDKIKSIEINEKEKISID